MKTAAILATFVLLLPAAAALASLAARKESGRHLALALGLAALGAAGIIYLT